jgi:WD40 repeat protein
LDAVHRLDRWRSVKRTDSGKFREEIDPDWSADGTKIVFGNGPTKCSSSIRILDINTHQLSTLPGSTGLYAPRWSPNGRYIAAMTFDSRSLMLFDFETQKWEEIAKITLGFPNWSKSGEYVYFLHEENQPSVVRVRIRDRKLKRVADLKNFRQAGFWSVWLGLAPDDSPLLLRDTGTGNLLSRLAGAITPSPLRDSPLLICRHPSPTIIRRPQGSTADHSAASGSSFKRCDTPLSLSSL